MLKAVNNFVWVIRDVPESEKGGLIIPGVGREKPHTGTVFSIGSLTRDKDIKASKGKKAIFHKTVGMEIQYKETTYLILQEQEIIGIE